MFIGSYPGENGRRGVDPQVLSSGYLDSVLSVGAFIDNHNQAEGVCAAVWSDGRRRLTKSRCVMLNPHATSLHRRFSFRSRTVTQR